MSIEQRHIDYYLNSRIDDVGILTVEFSHPSFSRTFYLVQNVVDGITLPLEDGTEVFFEYLPIAIRDKSANGSLDFGANIDLGDLGELIPQEIDRIDAADARNIKATLVRRDYRESTCEIINMQSMEVSLLSRNEQGASVDAGAPALNNTRRGELQTIERFPMLGAYR